ncbi:MAG: RsmB/NOP family class I SAM-dependent RNA methyltransferase [Paracoccus sp. (in: a-proteobacteria)]|nr:RsmB/NOP family class I SAM-dependent RNA methyltransferase [Paracoccus sp. (in: a-proteobacteria)]
MTPAARISAAISVLDHILAGTPAEAALIRWSRDSRFAGSGDRAAVRDLVFDSLRRLRSRAALGGARTGRGLMLGMLAEAGGDPAAIFTGARFAPEPLTKDEAAHLAARPALSRAEALDLPEWLMAPLEQSLGKQFQDVMGRMRDRAPVWLRVNEARATPAAVQAQLLREGITTEPAPSHGAALRVTEGERRVAGSGAMAEGLIELQDLSSQLAAAALPLAPGHRVLDYCAGGGGKVLALAGREPGARYTAHDANPARMRDLPARAARAGVHVALSDDGRLSGAFDLVLVDAPCSGSGTWRRTPDAKWRLTSERLTELIDLQADILDNAAPFVAAGGALAYMTCSLLMAENAGAIDSFLSRNSDFSECWRRRYLPPEASDGFFAALLIKKL